MKFHIYIQARVNSTRFPKKILKKIDGKSIFEILVKRLELVSNSEIFLITGSHLLNNELIDEAEKMNISYFSGDENNILNRFYNASQKFSTQNIIRITGDCPLIDFELVNEATKIFSQQKIDLLLNYIPRTYPHGFDFEIFTANVLENSRNNVYNKYDDENLFLSTFMNPVHQMIKSKNLVHYKMKNNIDNSNIRLTLDHLDDLKLISSIYQKLHKRNPNFTSSDILNLLKLEPQLMDISKRFV
tara:strand:- start:387 stop:1118 length:732 start_codon:yes stop_codon:yes gene_type:complete